MRDERNCLVEPRTGSPRTCANEGCGRPSEARLCDACALEWSLYHREERQETRSGTDPALRRS